MADQSTELIGWQHLGWAGLILVCIIFGLLAAFIGDSPLLMIGLIVLLTTVAIVFKYPFLGLQLYVTVFLFRPGEVFPALEVARLDMLTGGLAVLAVIVNQAIRQRRVTLPTDRISVSIAALLAAMYISVFGSYEATQTVNQCIEFAKILVFYYLIISLVDSRRRMLMFVSLFVLLIAYIGGDAYMNYLAGNFHHRMNIDRLIGTTSAGGDPNSLASTLSSAIPLFIALGLTFRNWLGKSAFFALGLCMIPLISITGSRAGILVLAALVIMGAWMTRYKLPAILMVIILGVGGWFALPEQYQNRYASFSEVSSNDLDMASSGRWSIWERGLKMYLLKPLTGVGAGTFRWANNSGDFGPPSSMESHNVFIQVAATTGTLGLVVWLTFLGFLVSRLRRLVKAVTQYPDQRWVRMMANGLVLSLISLVVAGMFGHNLYRYTWYVIAGLAVVLSNMVDSFEPNDPEQSPMNRAATGEISYGNS
ncbi:MAG: O-antigen ligase family protein [candidate division Zixibacteria bacterium]